LFYNDIFNQISKKYNLNGEVEEEEITKTETIKSNYFLTKDNVNRMKLNDGSQNKKTKKKTCCK